MGEDILINDIPIKKLKDFLSEEEIKLLLKYIQDKIKKNNNSE